MSAPRFHVLGIGNAIVDILAQVDDKEIERHGIVKGSMTLIDRDKADALYHSLPIATQCSGGSAGNTIAGIAALGGKTAYIGRVADDALGKLFTSDLRSLGVQYDPGYTDPSGATARSTIMVTPDAQRTMSTYLGDKVQLTYHDIDPELVLDSEILYIEGYLWDSPRTCHALREAMRMAKRAGRKVAFTLSDTFCVLRHRHAFLDLVDEYIDILFANEQEITTLLHLNDVETAARHISRRCPLTVITRGDQGALVVKGSEVYTIPAEKNITVVDTTGAGDLFAAGFLYGLTHDYDLQDAGECGARAAAAIIQKIGAR